MKTWKDITIHHSEIHLNSQAQKKITTRKQNKVNISVTTR